MLQSAKHSWLLVHCSEKIRFNSFLGNTVGEARVAPVFIRCNMECGTFIMQDVFDIFVDGEQVCQVNNFILAYTCFIASFYIFNLVYPSKICRTMLLTDKIIMELKPSESGRMSKKDRENEKKVVNLIAKLNSKICSPTRKKTQIKGPKH